MKRQSHFRLLRPEGRRSFGLAAALLAFLSLVPACGGGGGIDGSGYVAGPIQQVDTLVVAGVALDTTNAVVLIDGANGQVADLRVGMVVEVVGQIDRATATGSAMDVTFNRDIYGPIADLDTVARTFTVLGQGVRVVASTEFEDGTFEDLTVGRQVLVSGLRDTNEMLRATFVRLEENETEIEVRGTVTNLNNAAKTFRIGSQTIDFADALISGGTLAGGQEVEVESMRGVVGGILLADEIDIEDEQRFSPGDEVEIEGFITEKFSATEFELGGNLRVRVVSGTEFSGGSAANLQVNRYVEVAGRAEKNGTIRAEEIEIEDEESEDD